MNFPFLPRNSGTTVGVVTGYGVDDQGVGIRVPVE
jgi:hypothetical protein